MERCYRGFAVPPTKRIDNPLTRCLYMLGYISVWINRGDNNLVQRVAKDRQNFIVGRVGNGGEKGYACRLARFYVVGICQGGYCRKTLFDRVDL